jgi:hypothetical protein
MTVKEVMQVLEILRGVLPGLPRIFGHDQMGRLVVELKARVARSAGLVERTLSVAGVKVEVIGDAELKLSRPARFNLDDVEGCRSWGNICMVLNLALRVGESLRERLKDDYDILRTLGPRLLVEAETAARKCAAKRLTSCGNGLHKFTFHLDGIADGLANFASLHHEGQHPDHLLIGVSDGTNESFFPDYEFKDRFLSRDVSSVLADATELARIHQLSFSLDLIMIALLRSEGLVSVVKDYQLSDLSDRILVSVASAMRKQGDPPAAQGKSGASDQDLWLVPSLLYRAGVKAGVKRPSLFSIEEPGKIGILDLLRAVVSVGCSPFESCHFLALIRDHSKFLAAFRR